MKRIPLAELAELTYAPEVIVCPIDLADEHRAGLQAAVAVAATTGARLHVIHVLGAPPPAPVEPGQRTLPDLDERWKPAREAAKGKLDNRVTKAVAGHDVEVVREILIGVRYKEIVGYAEDVDADLIVMASTGRHGLSEHILGSVTERVIRLASCPVLTVPPSTEGFAPRKVIVASDLSACADRALPVARFIAATYSPEVVLTHVLPARSAPGAIPEAAGPPTMTTDYWEHLRDTTRDDLEERAALISHGDADVVTRLLEAGDPGAELVAEATGQGADLIIGGTRGNAGLTRLLLGSIAEKVVRDAPCAVLTVTPELFDDAPYAESLEAVTASASGT